MAAMWPSLHTLPPHQAPAAALYHARGGWLGLAWRGPTARRASRVAAIGNGDGQGTCQLAVQPGPELVPSQRHEQHSEEQEPWEQRRQQVVAFQQAHGWLPRQVANKLGPLVEGEKPLGAWCTHQQRRKEGSKGPPLSPEEVLALQAIKGWQWLARASDEKSRTRGPRVPWEVRRQQFAAFYQQHGRHPRQGAGMGTPFLSGEKELGKWCQRQRQRSKGNQEPPLAPEQVAALEATPGWTWEEVKQEPWEVWRQRFVAIWQEHGRLPRRMGSGQVPLVEGEAELASWCVRQRQRRKGNARFGPPLSAEQVAALEAIPGWTWEELRREPWEVRYEQVAAFQQQHGRFPRSSKGSRQVPLVDGEVDLGSWCARQRQRMKGNANCGPPLSAEQVAALDAIPGWQWDEWAETWEVQCQAVAAFLQQHGRLPRDKNAESKPLVEGEAQLGRWCSAQRQRGKGNARYGAPLSAQQVASLDAIKGWRW